MGGSLFQGRPYPWILGESSIPLGFPSLFIHFNGACSQQTPPEHTHIEGAPFLRATSIVI